MKTPPGGPFWRSPFSLHRRHAGGWARRTVEPTSTPPGDQALGIRRGLERGEDLSPGAVPPPAPEQVVEPAPRPVAFRYVTPGGAGAGPPPCASDPLTARPHLRHARVQQFATACCRRAHRPPHRAPYSAGLSHPVGLPGRRCRERPGKGTPMKTLHVYTSVPSPTATSGAWRRRWPRWSMLAWCCRRRWRATSRCHLLTGRLRDSVARRPVRRSAWRGRPPPPTRQPPPVPV